MLSYRDKRIYINMKILISGRADYNLNGLEWDSTIVWKKQLAPNLIRAVIILAMEDIFRPLNITLWRPGKCGDHAGWVQKAAQGCLSVGSSVWRKQNVQLKGMIWLFLLKDVHLCRSSAPLTEVSIAQRHNWEGFSAPLPSKTLSGATGQVGGNL